MNPIVISTIIGAGSFILTIFSAIYLNQRHVDKLIEQMEKRFEARMDALRAELKAEIAPLHSDVGYVKQSIEKIERQLETIFSKLLWPKNGD